MLEKRSNEEMISARDAGAAGATNRRQQPPSEAKSYVVLGKPRPRPYPDLRLPDLYNNTIPLLILSSYYVDYLLAGSPVLVSQSDLVIG